LKYQNEGENIQEELSSDNSFDKYVNDLKYLNFDDKSKFAMDPIV